MKRTILALLVVLAGHCGAGERWTDGPDAERVLGQDDFVSSVEGSGESNRFDGPWGVAIDPVSGKVFVADNGANRVLRFASYAALTDGADAEAVFGQSDFGQVDAALSAVGMNAPQGVTCDADGRLWVSDTGNARVLRFDDAANLGSGAAADGVLGQPDFVTATVTTSASGMRIPRGLAVDADGNLFVADLQSCRVTMYADAANLANGADASIVFGQMDTTTFASGLARNRMSSPNDVAIDSEGRLYVTDRGNHRILRFDNAAIISTGALATSVIGQANFVTNTAATNRTGLNSPAALDLDPEGNLWVLDAGNLRVLRYEMPSTLNGNVEAAGVIGQDDFDSAETDVTRDRFILPEGLAVDGTGRVYVSNRTIHRVLVFVKDRHFPDLTIGANLTAQRGNNVRNLTGAGQKQVLVNKRKEVKFLLKAGNDGNVPDDYRVSGLRGNARFTHSYFSLSGGRVNVTGGVVTATHLATAVAAGGSKIYELRMKPRGKFRERRITGRAWLQAVSLTDGEADRVLAEVKNRP